MGKDMGKVVEVVALLEGATIEYEVENEYGRFESDGHYAVLRTENYVIVAVWSAMDNVVVSIARKGSDFGVVYQVITTPYGTKVEFMGGPEHEVNLEDALEEARKVIGKYGL